MTARCAVVVVDVDPLDRRACGRRACGRGCRASGPGAEHHLRAARERDAVDDRLALAGGRIAAARAARSVATASAGRGISTRPCSAMMSSGVAAAARSSISRTAGSATLDLRALGVAQRVHVEQQRLLDLGVVEQVAAALGRDLRVVGQHDRAPSTASSASVASTGQMLTLSAPLSSGERKRPAEMRTHDVRRDQRPGERAAAVEPATAPRTCCARSSARPPTRPPRLGAQREAPAVELGRHPLAERRPGRARRGARRPRGARRSGPGSGASRSECVRGAGIGHALEPGMVERPGALRRVGRRVHDPERRRGRVLGRPGRVRVQRVALVEQRCDELLK